MDFQGFVDCVGMACCILSVEKTPEGHCGEIRIVCSNQEYKDTMGPAYYDNMPYYELVPKDNKFEEFCFQAAFEKKRMHAYVETRALNCWTDQSMIPIASDREDLGYCQFIFEFTPGQEADRVSFVSFNVASVLIRSCIKLLGSDDIRVSVGNVLDDIMKFSDAMAGRIMLVDQEKKEVSIFCESVQEDIWPERDPENDVITYDLITTWDRIIGDSNAEIVKSEADLDALAKENPEWVASMRENKIESLALIPLRREQGTIGYLYVVNYDVDKYLEVKELIELISLFLGSEISNYLFIQQMEQLSNHDDLTGLKNRHALMKKLEEINEAHGTHSFGIINLDMNGLKSINDSEGHVAGDARLIEISKILRQEFRDDELYRIGGDEFIVLIPDISEEVFSRRVECFREKVPEEYYISLAMGSFWTKGDIDTEEAFMQADHSMYMDKKSYYERHPEKRRD